ncbi:DinB family protein [Cohnella zeiphila]|uniref:DinB family protein n=1 Tax=Cohnella zeiphila TaxID=2761120 RepID=A0A7X0SNR2_9BACL|nr:DinB family protein [Cohnella zeiphila]MBB6733211.1 DinB family protein [Cohnella zeiphila]
MNTKEILRQFEETVAAYIRELDRYGMEQLTWVPEEGEWSLGQMYMHLALAAQFMQLRNARLCLAPDGNPAVSAGEMTEEGKAMFAEGSFPPTRVRVPPSPQYTPPQPSGKEQIVQALQETLRQMREFEGRVAAALADVADAAKGAEVGSAPDSSVLLNTVAHPRLGGLNALQWFRLIEMHYRHHLLQKKRLEDAWRAAHV